MKSMKHWLTAGITALGLAAVFLATAPQSSNVHGAQLFGGTGTFCENLKPQACSNDVGCTKVTHTACDMNGTTSNTQSCKDSGNQSNACAGTGNCTGSDQICQ